MSARCITTGRYGVILADPPWSYERQCVQGAAAKEYATMPLADICALPVGDSAARDAVLLLWATWPLLPDAFAVIDAWGFRYLTGMPWVKIVGMPRLTLWGDLELRPQYGVGYWVRTCSELLLIARRGNVSPPDGGALGLLSENFGHSRKPDNIYDYAERLPGPYLELFARRPRAGWDAYGDQVTDSIGLTEAAG